METTENKEISYAGFWLRFAAHLIDYFILQTVVGVLSLPFIFGMITGIIAAAKDINGGTDAIAILGVIFSFIILIAAISIVVGWLYFGLMESSKQQGTVGKMAVGIIVTDIDGNRISFARATGRYFGKMISNMTIYIGYIMAGFTERKQALHDIISDCLVIKK